MLRDAQKKALKLGFVKRGDLVAITAGLPLNKGTTNMITVKSIAHGGGWSGGVMGMYLNPILQYSLL
jgi:hypothetical protein